VEKRRDVENDVAFGRRAERSEVERGRRAFERRRSISRRRRRNGASVFDHGLQMPVDVAAPLGRRSAIMAGRTVLRGGFELRGNARGGAGRIQQEGKDEHERHALFYSGGRVTMDS